MGNYIISGLGPSQGGVGRLVDEIIKYAEKHYPNVELIYIYAKKNSFFKFLKESFLGDLLKTIFYKFFTQKGIKLKLSKIQDSTVLLIHPQTLGFGNVLNLFNNRNHIYMYVMDCSFFCLRSYNHIRPEIVPCLKCLSTNNFQPAIENGCKPFPVSYSVDENIQFLKFLKDNYQKFTFLTQNKSQQQLVEKHFGSDVKTLLVGMYTNEITYDEVISSTGDGYDIVYHGSLDDAKGLPYLIQLAGYIKGRSILVPYSVDQFKAAHALKVTDNIIFKELTWESGLKQEVINAKMVINPSVWSAPIEGAMLKSIRYNGCVAVVDAKYSFGAELAAENVVLALNSNFETSASLVQKVLSDAKIKADMSETAQQWLKTYLAGKELSQQKMFEYVFGN